MYTYTLPTLFLLLFALAAKSQEIISSSGIIFSNDNRQISWTLGEPVIETTSGGNTRLTQGFHQTNLVITAINEVPEIGVNVSAYPNPTSNYINVEVKNRQGKKLDCILYNVDGKELFVHQLESDISRIPMQHYIPATYFLKISANNTLVKTFKIVKN